MSIRETLRSHFLVVRHWRAGDYAVAALKVLLPYLAVGAVLLASV